MSIRIKWEHGQWWAYFNGHYTSYIHSERLDWMCDAIAVAWPSKAKQEADNNG